MRESGNAGDSADSPAGRHPRLASPALFLALAFAAGVGVSKTGDAPPVELLRSIPALVLASALCLLAAAISLRSSRNGAAASLTLAGFVLAGALAAELFSFRLPPNHVSHLQAWGIDVRRPVSVEGVLRSGCVIAPAGCEFDLELSRLGQNSGGNPPVTHPVSGRIRVQVAASRTADRSAGAVFELQSGEQVQATMRLRQPHVSLNPGSFDFRERAANIEDLYWEGRVENPEELHRLSFGREAAPERVIETVRASLRHAIDRLYPPWSTDGRDGAVLKAVLLGDRASLDSATIDRFRASGLYHLLVIAGLHVGLLAGLVVGLLRLLGLKRNWRNLILLAVLLAYAWIVEQRAPTLRATLMLVIFLLGQLLDRDHRALNAVGLAALALLVTRPAWLFESGFQLSFAAALLIVCVAAPVLQISLEPYGNALRHLEDLERDAALPPRQAQFRLDLRIAVSLLRKRSGWLDRHPRLARRIVVWPLKGALWAAGMALFSAILQLGLLLPMVEEFHRVTLAGAGLNALALPLMAVLLAVAVPTVLLALGSPAAAIWPAQALKLIFRAFFAIAEWPHLPDWLSYRVPSPPLWVALGFAASLIALALSLRPDRRRSALLASSAAFALFALMLATAPFAPKVERGLFGITALDCGGGEAVFLTLPDRTTVLIGAGGTGRPRPALALAKRWDPGENVVSPYLWSRRIKSLDALVVTSVAGNLEGFVSLLGNFHVGELWFRDTDAAGLGSILEEAAKRGTRTRAVSPGESLRIGATVFDVLTAPQETSDARVNGTEPLMLLVSASDGTALIASSISTEGQRQILEAGPQVRVLVLATGRTTLVRATGSTSNSRAGGAVADPSPASRLRDAYGSPSTGLETGNGTFATGIDGAITVEMKESSIRVSKFRDTELQSSRTWAAEPNP